MRLRQVVLAAHNLDQVVEDLRAVFDLDVGHQDPNVAAFGLRNAVFPVGTTFLEVVSPLQPGTSAGRFLDRRGGDGAYMVMLQTADFGAARCRIDELGIAVVFSVELGDITEVHLHPRDVPGAILAVSAAFPAESWRWAGPDWQRHQRTDVVEAAIGVLFEAVDPHGLATQWGKVLGLPADEDADTQGAFMVALDGARLRFDARLELARDGIIGFEFLAKDAERALRLAEDRHLPVRRGRMGSAVKIGGTWLCLRDAAPGKNPSAAKQF